MAHDPLERPLDSICPPPSILISISPDYRPSWEIVNPKKGKEKVFTLASIPDILLTKIRDPRFRMEKRMSKKNNEKRDGRMIHIRLPEEVHKRLRIKVAELDTTIQDWAAAVVAKELERQEKRK
jgi:hypothetical protein